MNILAIETSCDETSVAVIEDGKRLRSLVVNSQIDIHKAFGGVVPEIAARSHIEVMLPVVDQALEEAFGKDSDKWLVDSGEDESLSTHSPLPTNHWDKIDAIAVTQGPGLLGSLLIGVLTARALAWSYDKPLIAVHHILGHVYANWISEQAAPAVASSKQQGASSGAPAPLQLPASTPEFPVLALIVSGGHTQLMYGRSHDDWRVIGRTRDDAVGEAFDKVAKVLGLPYPGGVSVSKLAQLGDPKKYHLPTPRVTSVDPGLEELRSEKGERRKETGERREDSPQSPVSSPRSPVLSRQSERPGYDFSFSGLKTAVLRAVQVECGKSHDFPSFELAALLSDVQKQDFAASFESTAVQYLVSKTKAAFEELQPKTVIIGGGVAASLPLREALSQALNIDIQYAPQILCTDNAAMIGARAFFQAENKQFVDPRHLEARPSWPL